MKTELQEIALAIIFDEEGRALAARRGPGHLEGFWEFPGGKIAGGETPEEAAVRECHEELGARIRSVGHYPSVQHEYDAMSVLLHPVRCVLAPGEVPRPLASSELRWVDPEELKLWNIPPANHALLEAIVVEGRKGHK